MGIMFLVFTPIPYMDASSASAFRERRRRVTVGAAGIMVELFIAAIALFVWSNAEPGTLRAICYNIVLIASVSTLVFNGNPLLRYDGYYILSDFLEIPNLGPRGNNYLGYLLQRYLLQVKNLDPPVATAGERVWFCLFSVSAFIYRAFVYTAIILFVAGKFFVIGVLLAIWGGISMAAIPLGKGISFLFTNAALRNRRQRAFAFVGFTLALIVALLFYMPFPLWTMSEGVVWIPDKSIVHAGTDGFIGAIEATPGKKVAKGDLLVQCYDPLLPAEVKVLESQLQELQAKHDVQKVSALVEAEITLEEMKAVQGKLDRAKERLSELEIKSTKNGLFIVPRAEDMPGKFVKQGEMVAYVVEPTDVTVSLVVPQAAVDLVRQRTQDVLVRFADNLDEIIPARIIREVPGATSKLPSSALGSGGGGEVAIDPRDKQGKTAFQNVFAFEIKLREDLPPNTYGGRVFVRFDHGVEPLAMQGYRALRRLFLRRFSI